MPRPMRTYKRNTYADYGITIKREKGHVTRESMTAVIMKAHELLMPILDLTDCTEKQFQTMFRTAKRWLGIK